MWATWVTWLVFGKGRHGMVEALCRVSGYKSKGSVNIMRVKVRKKMSGCPHVASLVDFWIDSLRERAIEEGLI